MLAAVLLLLTLLISFFVALFCQTLFQVTSKRQMYTVVIISTAISIGIGVSDYYSELNRQVPGFFLVPLAGAAIVLLTSPFAYRSNKKKASRLLDQAESVRDRGVLLFPKNAEDDAELTVDDFRAAQFNNDISGDELTIWKELAGIAPTIGHKDRQYETITRLANGGEYTTRVQEYALSLAELKAHPENIRSKYQSWLP